MNAALAERLRGYAGTYREYVAQLRNSPCNGPESDTIAHYQKIARDLDQAARIVERRRL